jgi:isopentenyl diphosphate isomerase/L-lactate dehydrogenase-like FMN-dependent dehydrogenase
MAYPFLRPATESANAVVRTVERIVRELRVAMLCLGARTIEELQRVPIRRVSGVPPIHPASHERSSP